MSAGLVPASMAIVVRVPAEYAFDAVAIETEEKQLSISSLFFWGACAGAALPDLAARFAKIGRPFR